MIAKGNTSIIDGSVQQIVTNAKGNDTLAMIR